MVLFEMSEVERDYDKVEYNKKAVIPQKDSFYSWPYHCQFKTDFQTFIQKD